LGGPRTRGLTIVVDANEQQILDDVDVSTADDLARRLAYRDC
jgi:hypothetical protein